MTDLMNMGGYELYVWGSVGLGLAVFAWNLLAPGMQRRAVITQLVDGDADDASGDAS